MPVYLCQPGSGHMVSDSWRHGMQVFAAPFPIDERALATAAGGRDLIVANWTLQQQQQGSSLSSPGNEGTSGNNPLDTVANASSVNNNNNSAIHNNTNNTSNNNNAGEAANNTQEFSRNSRSSNPRASAGSVSGPAHLALPSIRRIRHAEVVIVDDVCIAYDRYWLRVRWPGHKGGFAGYIAMGLVSEQPSNKQQPDRPNEIALRNDGEMDVDGADEHNLEQFESAEDRGGPEELDLDERGEEERETGSMPISEPAESNVAVTCFRTGLSFQSSPAMQLLAVYDDGITPPVSLAPFPTEPVFCRICREGLHDDADEEQPTPTADEDGPEGETNTSNRVSQDELRQRPIEVDPNEILSPTATTALGPVQPHPVYHPNPHALENPFLVPCECSGSMAFVHYLCVEQWRCRSRHPEALQGLNCETCGKPYALPPPASRPALPMLDQAADEFLDAMPPHVMAALRQPHIWWQMGAAIVRRRWLRPIAPVLMSPVVALYCRARRLLKKRGVARRRWACSLCRRRARWKCVRCLRSYYCSRQCQNVSWHIVHKHVCYKPSRFWWSVVVYGAASLALFPGILRDPLMYDLGLCLIPISFIIVGILSGGMATLLKKSVGFDLRGRMLELAVVLWTAWLSVVSWGLVNGFFGNARACHGAVGRYSVTDESFPWVLAATRAVILKPAKAYYLYWDRLAYSSGPWLKAILCTNHHPGSNDSNKDISGCFEHLPNANADFFLEESGGDACAADLLLVIWLYIASGLAYAASAYWKHRERERRRRRGRPHPQGPVLLQVPQHLHQD